MFRAHHARTLYRHMQLLPVYAAPYFAFKLCMGAWILRCSSCGPPAYAEGDMMLVIYEDIFWALQDAGVQGGMSGGSQPDTAFMDLRDDFTRYKRESEMTIAALQSELATIKGCMYQVYSVLGSQPPGAMLQV